MNYASQDLRNEHEGILFGLEILKIMVQQIQSSHKIERTDITGMIGFLKLFADKCHHGKEEELFFPSLERVGNQNSNSLIKEMLLEHTEGRKYITEMQESVGGVFKAKDFIEAASNYARLLHSHIEKENNILFTIADEIIPADKQIELSELFMKFEEDVMGKGTHEKLHKMLDAFELKYLAKQIEE